MYYIMLIVLYKTRHKCSVMGRAQSVKANNVLTVAEEYAKITALHYPGSRYGAWTAADFLKKFGRVIEREQDSKLAHYLDHYGGTNPAPRPTAAAVEVRREQAESEQVNLFEEVA